jgi:ribosomal protein S2
MFAVNYYSMQHKRTAVCTKCLKRRPVAEFASHQARGRWCSACYSGYFKAYNAKRYSSPEAREAELQRGRAKYSEKRPLRWERKRKLLAMFGGCCSVCGYSKSIAALDFDHVGDSPTVRGKPNPRKCRNVSHLLAMDSPEAFQQAIEEAKKCQVLCANCHREKTFPECASVG